MSKQIKPHDFSLMSHANYREAFDQWGKIKSQLEQAEAALQKLLFEGKPESFNTQRKKQVQAILEGQEPDNVKATEKWREDISRARERRNLFIEASKAQERKVGEQRMIASKAICESVLPKYKAIIQKKAKVLIAIGEVIVEEKNLRQAMNEQGVAFSSHIVPMPISTVGNPEDASSRFAFWLIEAVKNKYLEFKSIPKMFREKWFQSSGFRFNGDNLQSKIYSESDYAQSLKGRTIDAVLKKNKGNVEIENKNV